MTRAQDDKTFSYGGYVKHDDGSSAQVREHTGRRDVVLQGRSANSDGAYYLPMSFDEAEALAYRLLYAVKRIKEDTDGTT